MHIPDSFLCTPVCVTTAGVAAAAAGYSLHKLQRFGAQRAQRAGGPLRAEWLLAAGLVIGGLQAVNFPVAASMSAHLLGGAALAVLLGPWLALPLMSAVLLIQAIAGDGGFGTLGANILNMGVVTAAIGGLARAIDARLGGRPAAGFGLGFVFGCGSVLAAASCAAVELSVGRDVALGELVSAMLAAHGWAAIVEGLLTGAALVIAPRLAAWTSAPRPGRRISAAILGGVMMMAVSGPWASRLPDGLESVTAAFRLEAGVSAVER